MSKERLVVVGGDAAGMSGASKARRLRKELEILAFERSPHTSYAACGIPYHVGDLIPRSGDLVVRPPEQFKKKQNIDARVNHEVLGVDTDRRSVQVKDLESGRTFHEGYDQLLVATGAAPFIPDLDGADARGIFGVSTLRSGIRVRRFVDEHSPSKAVVLGGGYVAVEMAEALLMRGIPVTLVQRSPEVMSTLDPDMGKLVSDAMREAGVTLHLGETPQGFLVRDGAVCGVQTSERSIDADLVVLGLGVRPSTALAAEASIPLGERGAIRVDDRLHTEVDGVWAAGDCADSYHLLKKKRVHMALATVANKHGLVAGTNIGGGDAVFPGVLGTAITKFYDLEVARTGLNTAELRQLGIEYDEATIKARTRAHYYPGATPITVKVFKDKSSGRLMGGQIVGGPGAGKRIDILATALHASMTPQQVAMMDISYAPPFSPVWDPVQIACRVL